MNPLSHARSQPHHVRRQIAFVLAGGGAALIAFMWLIGSLATGSFAVKGSPFAVNEEGGGFVAATPGSGNGNAAAAALSQTNSGKPEIHIVDTGKSSTLNAQGVSEPTIIPF